MKGMRVGKLWFHEPQVRMMKMNRLFCSYLFVAAVGWARMFEAGGATNDLPRFRKQVLTDKYFSDGITAGDINRDGKMDVVAGPWCYEGPSFSTRHAFYPPVEFPTPPSPTDSMFSHVHDFNGDGWPDILVLGRVHLHAAYWYENPKNPGTSTGPWKKHFAFERVKGESPPFVDVDGDGRPELAAHWEDRWGLIQYDSEAPTNKWSFNALSGTGKWEQFYHGTGVADVNGDARLDLLLNEGWYEQPGPGASEWMRHEFKFGTKGGAQMFAYDVNGDGRNDVITALDAHGWGLAWFEQVGGEEGFRKHVIMGDRSEEPKYGVAFSQPHALELADLDGDGLKDIVAGKRMWAHGPTGDIEPNAAPVLYWFQLGRDGNGKAKFVPHLIDDKSGVGVQLTVQDLNGDGRRDILSVSKLGAFVFWNERHTEGK